MALADPPELLFDPGLRVLLLSGVTYGLPASRSCHGLLGTPPPAAPTLTLALLLLLQGWEGFIILMMFQLGEGKLTNISQIMEEAASGSLCCHHRDEWRLPLAQMLPGGAPERIVAIDRRNTRRESSQGHSKGSDCLPLLYRRP
ncbi:uncharacterized protein [Triticum aestivum]|uniref:uncharacterized protein n=1 Tax=Triticum aestivum TaxID=4565 RepID=UPI001D025062|nr:uncharacterized protein LOC123088252 [Triticum aestivum]